MTSRLSYNIHGQNVQNPARLLAHLQKVKPAWALVMDNLDLARQTRNLLPGTNVIFRAWPDDGLNSRIEAEAWVMQTKAAIGSSDLWAYAGNEPGWSAYAVRATAKVLTTTAYRAQNVQAQLQAHAAPRWFAYLYAFVLHVLLFFQQKASAQATKSAVRWSIEVIQAARKYNLKVVVLNLSSGTPNPDDWKSPLVLDLLRLLDTNRDMAVIGLHEYACGVVTSGFVGGWPQFILKEDWPSNTGAITMWHMGRYRFLISACEANGIGVPRIVVTEFGFDDMSDVKSWAEMLVNTPPFLSIRGWKSLINQWRDWWPSWTPQRALYEQLSYADRVIYTHPAIEGLLVFCYGASGEAWVQFNVEDAEEYLKLVETGEVIPPMGNIPAGNTWQKVTLAEGVSHINLRAQPGTAFADVGDVKTGDVLYIYPEIKQTANGYDWVKVDQVRAGEKLVEAAWFAVTHPSVTVTETTKPVPPSTEPDWVQAENELLVILDDLVQSLNTHAQAYIEWRKKYLKPSEEVRT